MRQGFGGGRKQPSEDWLRAMGDAEDQAGCVSVGGLILSNTEVRTKFHPEANGRTAQPGEQQWTATLPLEDGTNLIIRMGKKDRDILFGMLIADCHDNNEAEPQ